MKYFIALDLETTGLDRATDEVIEVALVLFEEGVPTQSLSRLVRPEGILRPFITKLTGISAEELSQAPAFAEVAQELIAFIGDHWLVAYNADFDQHFLNKAFQKAGMPALNNEWLDALLAARTAWPRLANHRLETVVHHLQLEKAEAHRALPDAIWAGQVLLHGLQAVREWPQNARESLALLSRGTPWKQFSVPECLSDCDHWPPFFSHKTESAKTPPAETSLETNKEMIEFFQNSWSNKRISFVEQSTEKVEPSLMSAVAEAATEASARWVIVLPTDHLNTWSHQLQQRGVKATIVRRFDRYVCHRRLELFTQEAENALTVEERQQMMPMLSWWHSATEGEELDDSTGFNARRNFQLWKKICSHPAACSQPECGEKKCAALIAREAAEQARVLLIDHEYFFHDIKSDLALLPHWDHIVITDAERIPQLSIEQTERFVRFYHLRNIIQRFHNPWSSDIGLLDAASSRQANAPLFQELSSALQQSERELQKLLVRLGNYAAKLKTRGPFSYNETLIGAVRVDLLHTVFEEVSRLATECEQQSRLLAKEDSWFALLSPEFAVLRQELQEFRTDLHALLEVRDPQRIYWVDEWQNPHRLQMHGAMRSAGELIGKPMVRIASSICWIGAPLAARVRLNRFLNAVGIQPSDRLSSFELPTPPSTPTLLCDLASRAGENAPDFGKQLQLVLLAAQKVPGRLLLLIPTSKQLEEWQKGLSDQTDRVVLAEGIDGYLSTLFDHDEDQRAILLATDWTISRTLTSDDLLVIPRIPFAQGRSAYLEQLARDMERRGRNSSLEVILPEAALQLRRWIDAHPDTPTLVLDHRTIKSRYAEDLRPIWGEKCELCENDISALEAWLIERYPAKNKETL